MTLVLEKGLSLSTTSPQTPGWAAQSWSDGPAVGRRSGPPSERTRSATGLDTLTLLQRGCTRNPRETKERQRWMLVNDGS